MLNVLKKLAIFITTTLVVMDGSIQLYCQTIIYLISLLIVLVFQVDTNISL